MLTKLSPIEFNTIFHLNLSAAIFIRHFAYVSMKKFPVYSIDSFKKDKGKPYQIEVFDANRHFEVEYPHCHDFFEILYLTKGSGVHIIDNNRYDITPPCIFFLSPGQAHKLELSEDVAGYIYLFTGEFYQQGIGTKNKLLEYPFFFNLNRENPPLHIDRQKDEDFLSSLFERGVEEMRNTDDLTGTFSLSLLDLVLCTCERLYPAALRDGERQKGNVLVKRFRECIEENYHKNLSIKQYADLLHISENHLTHAVKERTSKTSKELIRERQIIEIKRLLKYSELSITEISHHFNFKDQSYFTKFFKKSEGMTPHAYRENN